jgi:hypothetical protein
MVPIKEETLVNQFSFLGTIGLIQPNKKSLTSFKELRL